MVNRLARIGALALVLAAGPAVALDPPHGPAQGKACSDCHIAHNSVGGSLTKVDGNANLCDSCHGSIVDTDGKHFGFPWTPGDQAVPGSSGHSHRWDASATSRGANVPANTAMSSRLDGGNITCSVCHDQHNNTVGASSGTQHVGGSTGAGSVSVGSTWAPNFGTGSGTMKLETVAATAAAKGYRVRVNAASGTQLTYDVSHDAGTTWFTGATITVPSGIVNLDDGSNVQVSFGSAGSAYRQNDYWEFWVSYPLLRMSNADGAMCLQCHVDRDMRWQDVEGGNAASPPIPGGTKAVVLGTTVFSHPVGQPLANAYDRTVGTNGPILDADGSSQAGGTEANKTNDLAIGTGGAVTCLTCHNPHNADSNSLTVDPR